MSIKHSFYKRVIQSRLPHIIKKPILNRLSILEGGEFISTSLREYFQKKYGIKVGYGTYGGCFNHKNFTPNVTIGNYCSIAEGVKVFRANHPIEYFTTHPIFYNPSMGFVKSDKLHRPALTIGHDVWIGANAIITPGCSEIGNGAIIGAGSIVTKDVAPYSIVAGNPAKEIRKRFNEKQIEYLENLSWWNLDKEHLINKHTEIQHQLSSFLDKNQIT